jgi:hypothetical protein
MGFPPTLIMGFGINSGAEPNLDPKPPAKMITFIFSPILNVYWLPYQTTWQKE